VIRTERLALEPLGPEHVAGLARILGDPLVGVGRGGLPRKPIDGSVQVEAGWTIAPERWGQGLATELGAAAVADARERGIAELVSITLPHNAASRRVMEKLGFAYDRDIAYAGMPHVLYRRAT
jgi:ribosomal-protein-alanine N-acetyltransferase